MAMVSPLSVLIQTYTYIQTTPGRVTDDYATFPRGHGVWGFIREKGDPGRARDFLPGDKQYLITRNGGCLFLVFFVFLSRSRRVEWTLFLSAATVAIVMFLRERSERTCLSAARDILCYERD
jgi:hypothetical protein